MVYFFHFPTAFDKFLFPPGLYSVLGGKCMKTLFALLTALIFGFSATSPTIPVKTAEDYMDAALEAAACGDLKAGRDAIDHYNELLDEADSDEVRLDFDELFLLSKLIHFISGNEQLTDEWRMCTGEVVMNRVASPEFPDSIEEVVFQEGQYAGVDSDYFKYSLTPSEECIDAALRLLKGERLMEPHVVFQASEPQGGELYRSFYDYEVGNVFFCTSPNTELYYPDKNAG